MRTPPDASARPSRRSARTVLALALSLLMTAGVTALTTSSAGAWTLLPNTPEAPGAISTTNNACKYNYDGAYRTHGITLTGSLLTTSNPAPVAGEVITVPAGSVSASAEISDLLVESAYQLGLLQLGVNTIPVQVWISLAGTSTARSDGPTATTPATQTLALSGTATTTISGGAGGVSATPLAATLPLPETIWTALGGQVQFVQAKSGSLAPVTVAGASVDPQGTVFIAATLGTATMTLDCLPQRIPSGDGDSIVVENNTCIGNLAGYQASGGSLGQNREISHIDVHLDGQAVESGSSVVLRRASAEVLLPGDMILSMYRQQYGGFDGNNGFLDIGGTYRAWIWVAIEGANTVEGVQKVQAEVTWTPNTIVDPTPGAHPSQRAGVDPATRLTGRNSGDESATAQLVRFSLPNTTWTPTGAGDVTFQQGGPGSLGRVTGIMSQGYVGAPVNPALPSYDLDVFGGVFFRTWTKVYGANLDCQYGRNAVSVSDYNVAWPGGGRVPPQAPAARYSFAAPQAAPTFATATGDGYRVVTADGAVYPFGETTNLGRVTGGATIVGGATTLSGAGYWLVAADGKVSNFGDAPALGSVSNPNLPIVGMAATPSGEGYWLVASDGGIFAFGDAEFYGSTGDMALNKPIVGITSTPSGEGYWLVATDGGIFAFGDAEFRGSTGDIVLNRPIVGIASTPSGEGYRLVATDGGIFSFGDAEFYGSTGATPLNQPIVGMSATASGEGYRLVAADGGIFTFGDATFIGSTGGTALPAPAIGFMPVV